MDHLKDNNGGKSSQNIFSLSAALSTHCDIIVCYASIIGYNAFVEGNDERMKGYVGELLKGFYAALNEAFVEALPRGPFDDILGKQVLAAARPTCTKPFNDGVMLVWEYPYGDEIVRTGLAIFVLDFLRLLQHYFYERKEQWMDYHFELDYLMKPLHLGIGVSHGYAWKLPMAESTSSFYYSGTPLTVAGGLRDAARPFGLIADFGLMPNLFLERWSLHREGHLKFIELAGVKLPVAVWQATQREIIFCRRARHPDSFVDVMSTMKEGDELNMPLETALSMHDTVSIFQIREKFELQFMTDSAKRIKNGELSLADLELIEPATSKQSFHEGVASLSTADVADAQRRSAFISWAHDSTWRVHEHAAYRPHIVQEQHQQIYLAIKAGNEKMTAMLIKRHLQDNLKEGRDNLLQELRGGKSAVHRQKELRRKGLPSAPLKPPRGISSISMSGIGLIEDKSLQDALSAAYQSAEAGRVARTAEALFNKLTSSGWTKDTLCRFINGWRSTHGTALFVSGLMIRLHRLANKEMGEQSRNLLCQAAGEVGEIIPEDTGVSDTPHHQLFAQFADEIVGSDDWKLDRYTNPACDQFRSFVQEQRLSGPYQEAILTTAASENWNTGEYTYFAGMVQRWMTEKLGIASDKAKTASAYVVVHSGDTELGHFRHAIKAWQLFCRATGEPADPVLAKTVFERYIKAIGVAYEELLSTLR